MRDDDVLILKRAEVAALLQGRDQEVIDIVRKAYEAHAAGATSVPHSLFLSFPGTSNRIIALPAYLNSSVEAAGMKWVASFPGNIERGLERASALIVLNSTRTGRPLAILDGSIINARRTAASAVLALRTLHGPELPSRIGFIGCGVINFEIARLLRVLMPDACRFSAFDLDCARAESFAERCLGLGAQTEVVAGCDHVLCDCSVVSIATTAAAPHMHDLSPCPQSATLLHISLRDIDPAQIVGCDNVVDDVDHVCRAQTSIHLAEQRHGTRDFIRCTLGDVLLGRAPARRTEQDLVVFSPFGLGVLDVALATHVVQAAQERCAGTLVESFLA